MPTAAPSEALGDAEYDRLIGSLGDGPLQVRVTLVGLAQRAVEVGAVDVRLPVVGTGGDLSVEILAALLEAFPLQGHDRAVSVPVRQRLAATLLGGRGVGGFGGGEVLRVGEGSAPARVDVPVVGPCCCQQIEVPERAMRVADRFGLAGAGFVPAGNGQTCTSPSALTVTSCRWSGVKRMAQTAATWSKGGPSGRPVALSQRRTPLSEAAVASTRPSGLYAIWPTAYGCTIGSPTAVPLAMSHCSLVTGIGAEGNDRVTWERLAT